LLPEFDPRGENSGIIQPHQHPLNHFFLLRFLFG